MIISTSLPAWGVWIEIIKLCPFDQFTGSRSPHGECGLKSKPLVGLRLPIPSLPAWGVWIEISIKPIVLTVKSVAPRMGSVD